MVAFFTKFSSDSVIRKKALTITTALCSLARHSPLAELSLPWSLHVYPLIVAQPNGILGINPCTMDQHAIWAVKAELYLLLLPCQAARPPYNPTGYSAEPNAQSYFIHRYMFFPSVWHMYLRSTVY